MARRRPPVNLARLAALTGDDERLVRELTDLYLVETASLLAEMRAALAAGRPWAWAANSLKGASANVGADEIAALAAEAEGELPSAEWLAWLEASFLRVRAFLASRLSRREAPQARSSPALPRARR